MFWIIIGILGCLWFVPSAFVMAAIGQWWAFVFCALVSAVCYTILVVSIVGLSKERYEQ